MDEKNKLVVFQDKKIRRIWHKDEWWFSVVDIIEALTESADSSTYWRVLKHRMGEENGNQPVTNCNAFKLVAKDGKLRETDCVNTEGAFRIIQSVPSPKAEPFKLWLAKTGYERIQEIENPELAQQRAKRYYDMKGYPADWIEKRLQSIEIRQELTDEWKNREVTEEKEFAILTNEITKTSFGKTVEEYKDYKGLTRPNQNLRDHMTRWELIFTMLGEEATKDITKARDDKGLEQAKKSAKKGGEIARNARAELETETKESIVSKDNFLELKKRLEKKK